MDWPTAFVVFCTLVFVGVMYAVRASSRTAVDRMHSRERMLLNAGVVVSGVLTASPVEKNGYDFNGYERRELTKAVVQALTKD
jgi:hypothetical protein